MFTVVKTGRLSDVDIHPSCGCESVLYVQPVRDEETRDTRQEFTQKCMILFSGSILTSPVSMMNENKEEVQSSLGAHWKNSVNVHNCMALSQSF